MWTTPFGTCSWWFLDDLEIDSFALIKSSWRLSKRGHGKAFVKKQIQHAPHVVPSDQNDAKQQGAYRGYASRFWPGGSAFSNLPFFLDLRSTQRVSLMRTVAPLVGASHRPFFGSMERSCVIEQQPKGKGLLGSIPATTLKGFTNYSRCST